MSADGLSDNPSAVFAENAVPPEAGAGVRGIAGIGDPPPLGAGSGFNRMFIRLNVITKISFYIAGILQMEGIYRVTKT